MMKLAKIEDKRVKSSYSWQTHKRPDGKRVCNKKLRQAAKKVMREHANVLKRLAESEDGGSETNS